MASTWSSTQLLAAGLGCAAAGKQPLNTSSLHSSRRRMKHRDNPCCGVAQVDEWCPADDYDDSSEMILIDTYAAIAVSAKSEDCESPSASLRLLRRAEKLRASARKLTGSHAQVFSHSTEICLDELGEAWEKSLAESTRDFSTDWPSLVDSPSSLSVEEHQADACIDDEDEGLEHSLSECSDPDEACQTALVCMSESSPASSQEGQTGLVCMSESSPASSHEEVSYERCSAESDCERLESDCEEMECGMASSSSDYDCDCGASADGIVQELPGAGKVRAKTALTPAPAPAPAPAPSLPTSGPRRPMDPKDPSTWPFEMKLRVFEEGFIPFAAVATAAAEEQHTHEAEHKQQDTQIQVHPGKLRALMGA